MCCLEVLLPTDECDYGYEKPYKLYPHRVLNGIITCDACAGTV